VSIQAITINYENITSILSDCGGGGFNIADRQLKVNEEIKIIGTQAVVKQKSSPHFTRSY
jgi:hypothetical protein